MASNEPTLVNTSGWTLQEIAMLDVLAGSRGTDRSKLIRELVRKGYDRWQRALARAMDKPREKGNGRK